MKQIVLAAAAGSLATLAAPTYAADFPATTLPSLTDSSIFVASIDSDVRFGDDDDWDDDDDRRYRHGRRYEKRVYDRHGRYYEPRRISRRDRIWRGRDGNYYCRRDNGTTGLVIGAGVGALLGRTIDTRGDRTVGTLLGGALGAVIGREIDRGELRCR
ncbi:MAG: glycine zipper 2TM domain-containing protein [Pseudomonadota bacterium]